MIDKWAYIAYVGAWIAASIAISVTVYVTKNGNYLWFLIIPGLLSINTKKTP
jgi:hypothetical protein